MLELKHVFEHINMTSQHELPPFFNRNFYSCLCRAQKLDYLALNSIVELASFYMFLSKLITKITYFIHVVLFCIQTFSPIQKQKKKVHRSTTVPPHTPCETNNAHTYIYRSQNFFRKQKKFHLSIFNGLNILTKPKQQNGDPMAW